MNKLYKALMIFLVICCLTISSYGIWTANVQILNKIVGEISFLIFWGFFAYTVPIITDHHKNKQDFGKHW